MSHNVRKEAMMFMATCVAEGEITQEQAVRMIKILDNVATRDGKDIEDTIKRTYTELINLEGAL